jgi:hypothetical protein
MATLFFSKVNWRLNKSTIVTTRDPDIYGSE